MKKSDISFYIAGFFAVVAYASECVRIFRGDTNAEYFAIVNTLATILAVFVTGFFVWIEENLPKK